MTRNESTKFLRDELDKHNLYDWKIRLIADHKFPLGKCSYKDKTIFLNALHIDTHPSEEVICTILHEVAHALTPGHNHDDVWASKAREIGCDNTQACLHYGLDARAIDAIRSGDELEVTFEEQVLRTPKYVIHKFVDKCEQCGAKAEILKETEMKLGAKRQKITKLKCGHTRIVDCDSTSPFEDLTFDGDSNCAHVWGTGRYRTICTLCNAKRLYEYQIEGARFLEKTNGCGALFDEQGLGKTIQFLAYLKYNPSAFPYLWVTKSGIKYQHGREILRILGDDYVPQVLTTGKQKPIMGVKGYLISWDLFRRFPDLNVFSHCQSIFLDECQALSNPDSQRTRAIRQVAKMIPRKVPASGTFWKNRGSEAFVALNMLAPARFPSFERFKKYDVEKYWHGNREKEGGLRPNFIEEIADIAIRRERKDVMPELPLITRIKLNCELPEYARKALDKEEDKYLALMDGLEIDGGANSFAGTAALNQSIMIMRQIIGIAKVDTTVEHAKEFLEETDEKLVIFRHHIEVGSMLETQLREWCKENDEPEPLVLDGGMSAEARFDIQNKFNSPHYRLLIASQLSAGEGLNLQTCHSCIMHERQWNPGNEEQCEGRFIRIGQESDRVTATYVHAVETVDTDLDAIVEGKRVRFHNSMNKGEMIVWNEDEIKQEIANKIRERRKKRKA